MINFKIFYKLHIMSFLRLRSMLPTKESSFSRGYWINTNAWLNTMSWADNEININGI